MLKGQVEHFHLNQGGLEVIDKMLLPLLNLTSSIVKSISATARTSRPRPPPTLDPVPDASAPPATPASTRTFSTRPTRDFSPTSEGANGKRLFLQFKSKSPIQSAQF